MTTPKHSGSRLVDQRPNVLRVIRRIEASLAKLINQTRPETLTFIPADPTRWEPCVSATMVNVLATRVYRSGDRLYADVVCGTGAGSAMEVQLSVPALAVTGTSVTTASGGTTQEARVTLTLPASWDSGASYLVYVQARRVSGADATTVRAYRTWQR